MPNPRVLLVDLNNFARYPSVAIGYLSSLLEQGDFEVDILAPLSTGLTGVSREPRPPWWGSANLIFRYRTGVSQNKMLRRIRKAYATRSASKLARSKDEISQEVARRLDDGVEVVLLSTYLMYHPHCVAIGELCRERGIPLVIGGPYFHAEEVASEWFSLPGLSALVGGEVEPHLCEIIERVRTGESLEGLPGVWSMGERPTLDAEPLIDLDALPFPDYSAFPWSRYPNVIVPIITGRGCGWGVCSFCSDITSTVGRTYRSRSPENVLAEVAHQREKHGANLFVFTDLKLNSNLAVWRALIENMQTVAPGSKWIGAVHVGAREDAGLSPDELNQAREAGMVRVTTGLEVGSQAILERMAKGTDIDLTSRFLQDAKAAGLSVRTTMMTGYPGETARDVEMTTQFLEKHRLEIERVQMNRFQIMSGTLFARQLENTPEKFPQIKDLQLDHRMAQIGHHYTETEKPAYQTAVTGLLRQVHAINRKPLNEAAVEFEGVM